VILQGIAIYAAQSEFYESSEKGRRALSSRSVRMIRYSGCYDRDLEWQGRDGRKKPRFNNL